MVASLEERLGRNLWYAGRPQESAEPIEHALTLAQHYELPETYSVALQLKGYLYTLSGRVQEAMVNLQAGLEAARSSGLARVEMGAENVLADLCMTYDFAGAEDHCLAGLALARRSGARGSEKTLTVNLIYALMMAGRFEEAYVRATTRSGRATAGADHLNMSLYARLSVLDALRGDTDHAREHLAFCQDFAQSDDIQAVANFDTCEAAISLAERDYPRALAAGSKAIDAGVRVLQNLAHESVRASFPDAVDAALALGELEAVDRLCANFADRPPGVVPPFLRMQVRRAEALVSAARGRSDGVEEHLRAAEAAFGDLGYRYWHARIRLDLAEWLAHQGRADEATILANMAATTSRNYRSNRCSGRVCARSAADRPPARDPGVSDVNEE